MVPEAPLEKLEGMLAPVRHSSVKSLDSETS